MRPWNFDAGSLNPGEISESYIFQNEIIKAYLELGRHDRNLFLVGSKGSGKTLLLRYKAYLFWNTNNPEIEGQSNESGELVENLAFSLKALSQNDLRTLMLESNWIDIWKFTLCVTLLRQTKIGLPEKFKKEIDQVFEPDFRISNIVSELLFDIPKFINSDYLARRNNALMARLNLIKNGASLFIDRLDQALDSMWQNGAPDEKHRKNDQEAFTIWKTAQFSLMKASYEINSFNSHIKIYTTIRSEAIMTATTLRENVLNYCTILEYSKEELREIFLNNIKLTNSSNYPTKKKKTWLKTFFDFSNINHLYVNDSFGEKEEEEIFDFLFRHTFGRPREILRLGKQVYDEIINTPDYQKNSTEDKVELIRRCVNNTAYHNIWSDYKEEIIPSFNEDALNALKEIVKKNIIPEQIFEELDKTFANYLYRAGLIGVIMGNQQSFVKAPQSNYTKKLAIQNSDYYFIHPSIDLFFTQKIGAEKYFNHHNIVGHRKPFRKPPPNLKSYIERFKKASQYTPNKFAGKKHPTIKILSFQKELEAKLLYDKLFLSENEEIHRFRINICTRAYHAILVISEFHFFHQFELSRNPGFSDWQKKKQYQLLNYVQQINYSRPLKDLSNEEVIHFGKRAVARIFILFCNIVLRMDYELIYDIIRNRRYEPKAVKTQAETALKFFRTHFFIKGLRDYPNQEHDLSSILDCVSELEKKCIKDWWAFLRESHLPKELKLKKEQIAKLPNPNLE